MRNYILKWLALTIPVLFGISVLVFSMLHLAPVIRLICCSGPRS